MGKKIRVGNFKSEDFERFKAKLNLCVDALEKLTSNPSFGLGEKTIGAEVELFITDPSGTALHLNDEIIKNADNNRLTHELNRYNIECNPDHLPLAGRSFSKMGEEIDELLGEIGKAAVAFGAIPVMVGILPTLLERDFLKNSMSALSRYERLTDALHEGRGAPFKINIAGEETLSASCDTVAYVGANTSFQLHLRVEPEKFDSFFNAAQLAAAPSIALGSNSPIFLGRKLWQETRIPLFKQACDERRPDSKEHARVAFGHDWQRKGVAGAFRELVERYRPLIPLLSLEDPFEKILEDELPQLEELRLHAGTVWKWTRPVYDPSLGGHVRLELRALPAGPTTIDMMANGAFLTGLIFHLAGDMDDLVKSFSIDEARTNFYCASREGLSSRLRWPDGDGNSIEQSARNLCSGLLPPALKGLVSAGVDADDARNYLDVVEKRLEKRQTGSVWQLKTLKKLEEKLSRDEAVREMTRRYIKLSATGEPVHTWPL